VFCCILAGETLTDGELALMIKEADLNGDNEISFEGKSDESFFQFASSSLPEFKKVTGHKFPTINCV
jgi:hypothetical protein